VLTPIEWSGASRCHFGAPQDEDIWRHLNNNCRFGAPADNLAECHPNDNCLVGAPKTGAEHHDSTDGSINRRTEIVGLGDKFGCVL